MFVKEVKFRTIKNSLGKKTIQVNLSTYKYKYSCSAPHGKLGGHYNEQGLKKSLILANEFALKIKNKNFLIKEVGDLVQLDVLINNFEKKYGKLGKSVKYILHNVFLKAASDEKKQKVWEFIFNTEGKTNPKIPMPIGKIVAGGKHTTQLKNKKPDFQEFVIIPYEETYSKAVTKCVRAYEEIRRMLKTRNKNEEYAWKTEKNNEEVLFLLMKIAEKYSVRIGIDVAASRFYKKGYYEYKNKRLTRDRLDQIDYIKRLIKKYDLFYVEDALEKEDFSGFKEILNSLKKRNCLIVGDDLINKEKKRLSRAKRSESINSVLINPCEIGSILELKDWVNYCKKNKLKIIFSNGEEETMDTIIADYAIGFGADYLKGGIMGKEYLIKQKRIIDIEKRLNKN